MTEYASAQLLTLFPKVVYCRNEFCIDQIDHLYSSIDNLNAPTVKDTKLSVNSSHQTVNQLHSKEEFSLFASQVMTACKEFASLLGYTQGQTDRLKFLQMWFNKSDKGDYNFPHIHNGCVFSGAYYVKTVPENVILFQDLADNIIEPNDPNPLSYRSRWVNCVPGLLLLFKSDTIHSTPRQETEGEKVVISFNIVMEF
jgi:uncharacterized protein (TIGR02466 family)